MQRIQIMLDDNAAMLLKTSAHKAGLSISSYARLLLNDKLKIKKLPLMEKAMLDLNKQEDDEILTLDEFKSKLRKIR